MADNDPPSKRQRRQTQFYQAVDSRSPSEKRRYGSREAQAAGRQQRADAAAAEQLQRARTPLASLTRYEIDVSMWGAFAHNSGSAT